METTPLFLAFAGTDPLARGALADVLAVARAARSAGAAHRIAVYNVATGRCLDDGVVAGGPGFVDQQPPLDSAPAEVAEDDDAPTVGRPGRPRLGVVSREVSLLPRHWDWLGTQRGGASAALRRLVDAARKAGAAEAQVTAAIEATHRFLWDLAGDLPGFEEATRALFARDLPAFDALTAAWPAGLQAALVDFTRGARGAAG